MTALIELDDLTIGWGDFVLMKDVNLTIEAGEIFVILGGSGCGKSSLLRHIIGLEAPMGGQIRVRGYDGDTHKRPAFGVMFQSGALFGSMTLVENVSLPLSKWTDLSPEEIDTIARARLRLVNLDGYEHFLPSEISGGMKKRAGIARALAIESSMLFLDEPSAGLDPVSAVELDELILTLNAKLGVTIVLVTHELQSIFKIAHRCIMLDKGHGVIAEGDPRELRDHSKDERVSNFFNRRTALGGAS